MRFFFDTEFIEDGSTIDLLSIAVVREDGATFYRESSECDRSRASSWVVENVLPHLRGPPFLKSRDEIRADLLAFVDDAPEFWAYYADYDWVALCQLFGTMMDLPKGWPMYCRDLKQALDLAARGAPPEQTSGQHDALADAQWVRDTWAWLKNETRDGSGILLPVPPASRRWIW